MLRYAARRIISTLPVLIGVTFIVFSLLYLTPGDPARLILGDEASEEDVQALRDRMGLNDPFAVQYFNYLRNLTRGDLGVSYTTGRTVTTEILDRLPVTARIAVLSITFAFCVGVPLGIISALKQYSILDNITRILALMGLTMPNFWLALLLILFFSVKLGWLPASGLYGPAYYVMPILSISAVSLATITRMTRSSMLEVIRQDYIRTARSKGLPERTVILKHALKNALIPVVTVIGLQFASGLGGAVVNEQVFSIPGVGKMMVDAIKARNYPVVQGGVLTLAIMFSLLNIFVDLSYALIDPRIRSQYDRRQKRERKPTGEAAPGQGERSND